MALHIQIKKSSNTDDITPYIWDIYNAIYRKWALQYSLTSSQQYSLISDDYSLTSEDTVYNIRNNITGTNLTLGNIKIEFYYDYSTHNINLITFSFTKDYKFVACIKISNILSRCSVEVRDSATQNYMEGLIEILEKLELMVE